MALRKTIKQFTFGEGFDTKPASEVTPIGKLHVLENARMNRLGMIQKKYGWTAAPTTINPTQSNAPSVLPLTQRVISHKDSLFAISNNTYTGSTVALPAPEVAYKYNESLGSWGSLGTSGQLMKGVASAIANSTSLGEYSQIEHTPDGCDIAIIGNMACVVKHYSYGVIAICLVDLPSMEVLLVANPAQAFGTPIYAYAKTTRVVVFNSKFYVFYNPSRTNDLYVDEFTPASASRTATSLVVTDLYYEFPAANANCFFDVDVNPSTTIPYLIYRNTAATTTVNSYTALTPAVVANTAAIAFNIISCVTIFSSGTNMVVLFSTAANTYAYSYTSILGLLQTAINVFAGRYESLTGSSIGFSGFNYLIGSRGTTDGNFMTRAVMWNPVTGGFVAAGTDILPQRYVLAGRAFALNGRPAFAYYYRGELASYQNTYYLGSIENSDPTLAGGTINLCPLARMFYGESVPNEIYASGSTHSQTLPSILPIPGSSTQFITCALRNKQVFNSAGTDVLRTVEALTFDFGDPVRYQDSDISNLKVLTGSYNLMLDGQRITELGFMNFPEQLTLVQQAGGALTALGTYSYTCIWEWLDAEGNIHRSAPSIPATIVLTGGNQTVNVTVGGYNNSLKRGVRCRVFRTETTGTLYYSIGAVSAAPQTFPDAAADTALIQNQLIYTTGGVLENETLSGCRASAIFKNRLFVVTNDGLFYSKRNVEFAPVEFSYALKISIESDGGDITGIAPLTDKLIIFKKDKIYFVAGDGPENTGSGGSFSEPQLITATLGAQSHTSLVLFGDSVMFQSRSEYWEIDKGLNLLPSGQEVANFFTETTVVNKTITIVRDVEARIQTNSSCFVYNTFTRQWSQDLNYGGPSMALWKNQFVFVRSNNLISFGSTTTWEEGGSFAPLRVITSWINLDAIEAYQRCYRFFLLLRFYTNHVLRVNVYYDYLPKVVDTFFFTADSSNLAQFTDTNIFSGNAYSGSGTSYMLRMHLKQQKCTAIRFEILENSRTGNGHSFDITGFALELGLKATSLKLPAAQSL